MPEIVHLRPPAFLHLCPLALGLCSRSSTASALRIVRASGITRRRRARVGSRAARVASGIARRRRARVGSRAAAEREWNHAPPPRASGITRRRRASTLTLAPMIRSMKSALVLAIFTAQPGADFAAVIFVAPVEGFEGAALPAEALYLEL